MKTPQELHDTLASEILDSTWVRYTWTERCAGHDRVKVKNRVTTAQALLDIWESGASDVDSERVEAERFKRTGIDVGEEGDLSVGAGVTLGDWVNALNNGDDTWDVEPAGEPTTLTSQKWDEVMATYTNEPGELGDLYEFAADVVENWEITHGELLDLEDVYKAVITDQESEA